MLSVRVGILFVLALLPAVAISQALSNGRSSATECGSVDVLIVSDLGLYGPVPQARTRLLETFTKAQAYFASAFEVELKMFVRDVMLPTDENPFPGPDEEADDMYDVGTSMKNWLAGNGVDIRQYDLVIGVYQTAYDLPYWGYCFAENDIIASIVMKSGLAEDVIVRLMAHEMGHAFGGTHDPAGTSLMSPMIDGGGSWSTKNKQEMNTFLALERTKSFFDDCPALVLDGQANGMNVNLTWTAYNERDVTKYLLYLNGVVIDSVEARGPSTSPLMYTFEHVPRAEGKMVYWLHQISKWGNVLENENAVVTVCNIDEVVSGAHPNPFSDTLSVMAVEPGSKIVVYNALSQRVVEHVAVEDFVTLYTWDWAPGLYFVAYGGKVHRVVRQ